MNPCYLVATSDGVVEAWSTTRLQFEPKDWQREFRTQLRGAIGTLTGSRHLTAQYRSPARDSCDTENILFYNVGTGAFAAASPGGLLFERGFVVPPCPADLCGTPQHYHRYETRRIRDTGFQLWREVRQLATFKSEAVPPLTATSKLAGIWLTMHQAQMQVMQEGTWSDSFALRLTLRLPAGSAAPVSFLKPLLDGVIAAFSAYEGPDLTVIVERLASQLSLDPATIVDLLTKRSHALLGSCRLVVLRAAGVQWQPPDDRCVACELRIESTDRHPTTLEGELLAVKELDT